MINTHETHHDTSALQFHAKRHDVHRQEGDLEADQENGLDKKKHQGKYVESGRK